MKSRYAELRIKPTHLEPHLFAVDVTVGVVAGKEADEIESFVQIKAYRVYVAGLSFEDKHTRCPLFCLCFSCVHKPFADPFLSVVFVDPQFGHSYSACPLFGIKFDSADKLFAVERAVSVRAFPMFLKKLVGVVVFFLRMRYRRREARG